MRDRAGETLIGTEGGLINVRSVRRKAGARAWEVEDIRRMRGAPWEPVPGREGRTGADVVGDL